MFWSGTGVRRPRHIGVALGVAVFALRVLTAAAAPTLTFVSASDTHFMNPDVGNDLERTRLASINNVMNRTLAGTALRSFRGVLCPGDLIDKGMDAEWASWSRDFGLNGGDGAVLQHPVYEDFGGTGHDGIVSRDAIIARNPRRFGAIWSAASGYNYSWDWNGIHFVTAGIKGGSISTDADRIFLANDLATHVGTSGRPVVVMEHEDANNLAQSLYDDVLKNYNVILILNGHESGGAVKWNGIQTLSGNGFLAGYWVVRISGTTLQASRTTGGSGNLTASTTVNFTVPASVASITGATDGSWDRPVLWSGGVTPQNEGDYASFDGSLPATITLDGARTISGLNLDTTGSSGYTLAPGAGGRLVLQKVAGPVSLSATGHHAITAPVSLANDAAVWVDANSTLTLGGAVSGTSRTLAKAGAGTLVLATANDYSGPTIANAGTLRLAHSEALPGGIGATGGTSALTISGGQVELTAGDFLRPLGTGAHQVQFLGPGGFLSLGSAGDRTVNLGGAAATVTWNTGGFVPTGHALRLGSTAGALRFANPIALGSAARTVEVLSGTARLDGGVSGTGGLTKTGTGTLILPRAAAYTGATVIEAGILQVGADDVTGAANDFTLAGTITGAGALVKAGDTLVTLATANTHTGGTTVAGGTLRLGHAGAVGFGAPVAVGAALPATAVTGTLDLNGRTTGGKLTLAGGALVNNSATAATLEALAGVAPSLGGAAISAGTTLNVTGGGGSGATATPSFGLTADSFVFTAGGRDYVAGDILYITGGGGSGCRIRLNAGGAVSTWTLIDPGSGYTSAPTTVTGGGGANGNGGRGAAITGNADNFQVVSVSVTGTGSGYTSAPTVSLSGGTGFAATAELSAVELTAASRLGGAGDLTIAAPIIGAHGLTKVGAGTLTLQRASTYTGATTISEGTVVVNGAADSALGTGDVVLTENGRLTLTDRGATDNMIANTANVKLKQVGASASRVTLNAGVNETVQRLYLNNAIQTAGTWGSSASAAQNKNDTYFAGTGVLTVLTNTDPGGGGGGEPVQGVVNWSKVTSGNEMEMAAEGSAGYTYILERSFTLLADSWVEVARVGPLAAAGAAVLTDVPPEGTEEAFYRLRVE